MRLDSFALALSLATLTTSAQAQLRLPSLPSLPNLPALNTPVQRELPRHADLTQARQQRIADLLRQRSDVLEADPAGAPARRGEVVVTAPSEALLAAARADGFAIANERVLDALALRIVTLRVPTGWDTRRALARLREIDPHAALDYNHLYLESGDTGAPPPAAPNAPAAPRGIRVGLIDGGVDASHPVFRDASVHRWGCGGKAVASAHGTAVASLLVGRAEPFHGAAPAATLYAADVVCGDAALASVDQVAAAVGWLLGEGVAVVNISLVGPANRTLEVVVHAARARGMLLVAAVGNDGPAAPPLYPAAYPEVVGVTGVDARSRVLPEAGRGPHVAFAAPGSDMAAAGGSSYVSVRGTSFAAPLVAGLLAASLHELAGPPQGRMPEREARRPPNEPDASQAALALAALARSAIDLGPAGRDPVYGHGLVGPTLRIAPALVMADR